MCVFLCVHVQESVEDMGLYEDVSGAGASAQVTVTPSGLMRYFIFSCRPATLLGTLTDALNLLFKGLTFKQFEYTLTGHFIRYTGQLILI